MLPRPVVPAATLAALLLLGACSDASSGDDARAPERFTAGDTLVVRTSGDVPTEAEWQLVEQWRAGSADGDAATSFSMVHSLGVTDDGHVLVFDQGGPVLRRYAPDGALVRAIGRKGSGPGEYDRVNGVTVRSDGHVVLWDGAGNSRLNVYAPSDSFVTQWTSPISGFNTSNQSLTALRDNRVAVRAYVRDSTLTREALGRTAWFVYAADGAMTDTIVQPDLGDASVMLIARSANGSSSRPVPYQPRPVSALHPDGSIVWSPGSPYVVHTQSDGRPLRIERTVTATPVSDEERSQLREQVIWGMRMTDPAWTWDGPEIANTKPALQDVAVTLDGQYLVRVSTPSEPYEPDPPRVVEGQPPRPLVRFRSRSAYELFTAGGELRGRFTVPRGATVHAVRGDDVWGTVTDEDDVPYLVRWRLQPPAPRP
jgi:hypothetical protein